MDFERKGDFTEGTIGAKMLAFAIPVLGALFLQSLYGAVDLLVVGQFGSASDVAAVANGSMMMQTVMLVVIGLSAGTTIHLGQAIGARNSRRSASILGTSVLLFFALAVAVTALMFLFAPAFARALNTPPEAESKTLSYVRICAAGTVFITAYNLLGGIFRGMGDSKTPLFTVLVACVANIAGDLIFVALLGMAAAGAAYATVIAQALSVAVSFLIIRRKRLPFAFSRRDVRWSGKETAGIVRTGSPIAAQDALTLVSFLVIAAIINKMGLVAAAAIGVGDRVAAFIMLVPSAFSQSLSAFVAQNIGARKPERARRAMFLAMAASLAVGAVMAWGAFFHGDALAAIFTKDTDVIAACHSYLKAYALDTLLVSFAFCFIGFFNGSGLTFFVMAQGLIGAFAVRIPVSYAMSVQDGATLFSIGLAAPASTVVQIALCAGYFVILRRKEKKATPALADTALIQF